MLETLGNIATRLDKGLVIDSKGAVISDGSSGGKHTSNVVEPLTPPRIDIRRRTAFN